MLLGPAHSPHAIPSMPTPKSRAKKATPAQTTGGEYRFHIDAFTPATIPMARLAQYMGQLAAILGEPAAVHFERLEAGSTNVVHRIEKEAEPKVRERVAALERGDGAKEAHEAYRTVNRMLREDNAVGDLRYGKRGGRLLYFPGREERIERFPVVREHASIDGEVVRVGGADQTVPILLMSEGVLITHCHASRAIAKQLGGRLFEQVRLHGKGRWRRDEDGDWCLEEFKVESFESLEAGSLTDALRELRAIPVDWGTRPYEELEEMRAGVDREAHGRS